MRAADIRPPHGDQGVEECGGGQLSGTVGAERRSQPGLGLSDHWRLGHHQDGARVADHRMTFKKSHVATTLPHDRARDLRPACRTRTVGDVSLFDPQPGPAGSNQQLQWIARPAIVDAEAEQRVPPCRHAPRRYRAPEGRTSVGAGQRPRRCRLGRGRANPSVAVDLRRPTARSAPDRHQVDEHGQLTRVQ